MIVNLKIATATWNEKKQIREVSQEDLPVEIDTSIRSHLKWEREFEPTVHCTLVEYHDRVNEWLKDKKVAEAHALSLMKFLYCYVNSDKLPDFDHFLKLFEPETLVHNLEKIRQVITAVGKTAPKN